jgi:hypothetical protein
MAHYLFNKYTAISMVVQVIACVLVWIVAFAMSPEGDRFFGLMFYFYLSAIFLVSLYWVSMGESGMIAAGVYGIAFGILAYGVLLGFIVSMIRGPRRTS